MLLPTSSRDPRAITTQASPRARKPASPPAPRSPARQPPQYPPPSPYDHHGHRHSRGAIAPDHPKPSRPPGIKPTPPRLSAFNSPRIAHLDLHPIETNYSAMDLRRPTSLLSPIRTLIPLLARGHKTTARTKRALKIAPHDSFLPARPPAANRLPSSSSSTPSSSASPSAPASPATPSSPTTTIIYNPPSSAPSPLNTPLIFIPHEDPRRVAIPRLRAQHFPRKTPSNSTTTTPPSNSSTASSSINRAAVNSSSSTAETLPPSLHYPRRQPKYHLDPSHIQEMRALRAADPLTWSVARLAARFDCSPVFVRMAAPAPKEHLDWLRRRMQLRMERWGPIKRQAWEDRKRRAEMLYRGEL